LVKGLPVYRKLKDNNYFVLINCNVCGEKIWVDYKFKSLENLVCPQGHYQVDKSLREKHINPNENKYMLTSLLFDGKPTYMKNHIRFILLKCEECNIEFMYNYSDYKRGVRPLHCPNRHRILSKEFKNKYLDFTKDGYNLSGQLIGDKPIYEKYTKNNNIVSYVRVKCAACNIEMWQTDGGYKRKENPRCSRKCIPHPSGSYSETFIEEWLIANNIEYEREKSFPDLVNPLTNRHLYYDFYLPKYWVVIEYHGEQHYEPIEWFGGIIEYFKGRARDQYKFMYACDKKFTYKELNFLLHRNKKEIEEELNAWLPMWEAVEAKYVLMVK